MALALIRSSASSREMSPSLNCIVLHCIVSIMRHDIDRSRAPSVTFQSRQTITTYTMHTQPTMSTATLTAALAVRFPERHCST